MVYDTQHSLVELNSSPEIQNLYTFPSPHLYPTSLMSLPLATGVY